MDFEILDFRCAYNRLCSLVGWSLVNWSGNAFVWRSTRRTLLAYLALFLKKNEKCIWQKDTEGVFLVRHNRVLNMPLGRLLCSFAHTAHSAYLLHSAPLRYARFACLLALFTGSLTHFAHSLVGQLKFLNMCSRCYRVLWVQTRFSSSLETRPKNQAG